ncbi:hypothetical protein IJ541_01120 [bacterium]|nr:hypothetical protein [bacterium]
MGCGWIATSDLRPPRNDMQILQGAAIATLPLVARNDNDINGIATGVNKTNLKVSTFTPSCNDESLFCPDLESDTKHQRGINLQEKIIIPTKLYQSV